MSNIAKKGYLIEIREQYFSATKTEKSLILDELCSVCGYNRKYALSKRKVAAFWGVDQTTIRD